MLEPRKKMYDKAGPRVAAALQKRNMEAYYCPTAAEAVEKVLELIPAGDVVSWGGVATVDELGIKGVAAPEDDVNASEISFFAKPDSLSSL